MGKKDLRGISVVVLAGGWKEAWAGYADRGYKALAPVKGRQMWRVVCDAFKEAGAEDIVVAADWVSSNEVTPEGYRLVCGGSLHSENLRAGLNAVRNNDVLFSTCDLPGLTKEGIWDLVSKCRSISGLQFGYPLIERIVYEADPRFAGMSRHWFKLAEGVFTGGNVIWMDRDKVLANMGLINWFYRWRKFPVVIAVKLGLAFCLKFLAAQVWPSRVQVRIEEIEAAAPRLIGDIVLRAIIAKPEIGADVDKTGDYLAYLAHV